MAQGPITPEDLYRFRWLSHVRLRPGGSDVAYQVAWGDEAGRASRGRIEVLPLAGGQARQLTAGTDRDGSPEWSPDGGTVAFLRRVRSVDQVHLLALDGAAERLTEGDGGAAGLLWSPDGGRLAYLTRIVAEPDSVVDDERPPADPEASRRPPVARIASRLNYKSDAEGYADGRHRHLAVVEARPGATPALLTQGPWGVTAFDWGPDGRSLVFAGNPDPDGDRVRTAHVIVLDLDGSQHRLVADVLVEAVAWSPRGDLIAYVAAAGTGAGLISRIWVVPAAGGSPRCLTADLDVNAGNNVINDMRAGHDVRLVWDAGGERIHFLGTRRGTGVLLSVDLEGRVEEVCGGRWDAFDHDRRDGATVLAIADERGPGDLYQVGPSGPRRLTELNPWLRERFVSEPRQHLFRAPDGLEIEGWLYPPPGGAGTGTPIVLQVHGGPHAMYGWSFFHEFQVLAGMGIAVLAINPRGSDGYGEEFRRAVVRDWAGADYADLMACLDQALDLGWGDRDRQGIAGGSYGGYMTNWAIGHTSRFRAAVSMRSISNLVSEYAQHDIVPWGADELGPPPWPDSDELWRRSPIRYVNEMRTPLLLTHGEMDLRCAISQAEELFGALRLLGRTVEMARFPGENHDFSRAGRPDRRVERLRRIAGWFERYLL